MKRFFYHVVTESPMKLGQVIVFDENQHSGVYKRVYNLYDKVKDIYNPDFDSFERVKTLYALLYKDLESFPLPKKMRIIFIILFVRKFFLNLYMYLFHNRF